VSLVVFAGPSISPAEVRQRLPAARVEPPARREDLYAAREAGAAVILMIDGVFGHQLAVPPSEVVSVLADGATVIGASSLGAVRAAGCGPAGMLGVGLVFRLYEWGALTSDDDVAVVTDPDDEYAAVSVALINVRLAARRARRAKLLDRTGALGLASAAEAIPFGSRRWPTILRRAGLHEHAALRELCERTDVKRDDALAAVRLVAERWPEPRSAGAREVPRRVRYGGHGLAFGMHADELRQVLLEWLFGSARYQRYIWALMVGEPEFASVADAGDRREALAAALARGLADPRELRDRLWEELDFIDELDAELERWYAFRERPPEDGRDALIRTRERLALAHGYPSWNSLSEDVEDGRLFGAIPFAWIETAVARLRR
jgi:hypothetical protein